MPLISKPALWHGWRLAVQEQGRLLGPEQIRGLCGLRDLMEKHPHGGGQRLFEELRRDEGGLRPGIRVGGVG